MNEYLKRFEGKRIVGITSGWPHPMISSDPRDIGKWIIFVFDGGESLKIEMSEIGARLTARDPDGKIRTRA